MNEILNDETKAFLSWAIKNKKKEEDIVADLVRSGWSEIDAQHAISTYLQTASSGSTPDEESFWKRNMLVVVLASVVIFIVVAFGIFILITQ